jgi:hypothetical protein
VEGAEVVEVVASLNPAVLELIDAQRSHRLLGCGQLGPVGQTEAVAEDSAAGIQVGVAAHLR